MKKYYAMQSPRGFANETLIRVFCSRAARDAWVADHCDDGDCNSAACGARSCTRREADAILRQRGDACTTQYNRRIEHGDEVDA